MSPIPQRFPIPTNDDDFEQLCLQLLRHYWSRPGLEIFGKRGERQFGIDILDVAGETPIYAAQCKLKEEHKNLPPAEIQEEVDKAKQFIPPLGKYGILTTAKVSTHAQRKVREINQLHRESDLFEVELLTWERLCSLLQQYTDVQEQFYGEIALGRAARIETHILAIKDGVQSLTAKSGGDEIDSEIDEAREYITKREFQFGTFFLNRIQQKHGHNLNRRQKFRVLSNHGAAALGLGKANTAAKFFIEAVQWQPEDEIARTNEVLAYFFANDLKTCHEKAATLRGEYPGSARLTALWLLSAPKEVPLSQFKAEINSVLQTDAEVCVALARRAIQELAFNDAFAYATAAGKSAPKWSQPQLVLAQSWMGKALSVQFGFGAENSSQETSLLQAEAACSSALELSREEKDQQTESEALVQRADIRLMLNKKDEATKDARDAETLDPENPQVMIAVAETHFASGHTEEGIAILKKAYGLQSRPDIAFMYGRALSNRGREGDIGEALNVLLQAPLNEIRSELRPRFVMQTLQCLAKGKDWPRAEKYLGEVANFVENIVLKIVRGYLAHYQERPSEAEEYALEAKAMLATANANADTKEFLARLLTLVGRLADALPIWQGLFDQQDLAFDPGLLLDCAARLHRDDLVMQTCDRLHARGVNEWRLLEFEIPFLEKYKIDSAIQRLREFIEQNPDNKLAKLQLSLIGLRLNKSNLIRGDPEDLPLIEELPVKYVVPAVQVMKYGGDPNAALDYAYRFLREHFNEIEAHEGLIVSMMPGTSAPDIPPVLEVVGPNAAICYEEIPQGSPTWVVLENTDNPNGDFEEISLKSHLAAELMDKKIGDTVLITRGGMQDRTAKIVAILPKYVRRYQDSMGEMQVRFGAASSVESIRVELSGDGHQSKGIEVILASVEKRAAAVAKAREIYNSEPASLHWYGLRFGQNAYLALLDLANERGQQVKCCFGTSEERNQALQAMQTAKAVIVDITALATLRLLSLEKVLSTTRLHFIISERTWVVFQEMLMKARIVPAPTGTLVHKDGKNIMYQETVEDRERRNRKDKEFVALIEETTEVRSASGLAALDPEKREALENFFGLYGAESMVLASDPDYVLWTDDLIQAQTSAQEFGTRRVWTQFVLGFLANAGALTSDEYSEVSASLVGMEFVATLFDSASVLAAVRLAGWSVDRWPATQMLKIFSDPSADLGRLVRIYVEFMVRLYSEALTPETRCTLTQSFLDALAGKAGAMAVLKSLRKLSSRAFGINEIGRIQYDQCFDRWLDLRERPLIYIPGS